MIELKNKINKLQLNEKFSFTYKGEVYQMSYYHKLSSDNTPQYTVISQNLLHTSMNVEFITDEYITLYSFNMMNVKSTYQMDVCDIKIVESKNNL
jgi:hypothetical protein